MAFAGIYSVLFEICISFCNGVLIWCFEHGTVVGSVPRAVMSGCIYFKGLWRVGDSRLEKCWPVHRGSPMRFGCRRPASVQTRQLPENSIGGVRLCARLNPRSHLRWVTLSPAPIHISPSHNRPWPLPSSPGQSGPLSPPTPPHTSVRPVADTSPHTAARARPSE